MSMDASTLSYQETIAAATDAYASGMLAVFVDGPPGGGKTTLSKYIQHALGLKARFIIKAGHHDVLDFNGLPVANMADKSAEFLHFNCLLPPPDLKGGCLMVWDEGSDAPVPIQNLMCQAVFEGGLHNYTFPEGTLHFITGNRVGDRSGANRVVTKLGNRVAWYTLDPQIQEVFDYGVANGWNPAVLAFLKLRGGDPINPNEKAKAGTGHAPTYFNSFDPSDPAQMIKPVFASSRSIEFASNLVNYIDRNKPGMGDGAILSRLAGMVGTPWASAFVPFRSEAQHMPDPDAILRGDKVPFPKKESVLWTLTITLVTRVLKDNWANMDKWLKQGPAEFRVLAVRLAFDTKAKDLIGPAFNATLQEADIRQALTAK